ncbi:TPA: hypothetical protein VAH99_002414 [Legionella pneumophila]|nr:hypothetical protein [Legionella pneumophila]HCC3260906.1 hypothetical protein [Legionella pneumophila subsp. pneumophila]MCW8431753.1 hypothetical protein [Legionella pneumophila]MCZ4684593.1 hypothetical protein [Legionella pneumophila]MDW9103434.1 hypothetical protein [Legionella pneumophila]MDW9106768.1 hypothetical protein [Legionella pneumophila]
MSYLIWCVRTNGVLRLGVGGVVMANIPVSLLENCSDAEKHSNELRTCC